MPLESTVHWERVMKHQSPRISNPGSNFEESAPLFLAKVPQVQTYCCDWSEQCREYNLCSVQRLIFSNFRYFQISSVCNFALFHELISPDSFGQIDLCSSALIYLYFKTVASLLSADESLRCFVVSVGGDCTVIAVLILIRARVAFQLWKS